MIHSITINTSSQTESTNMKETAGKQRERRTPTKTTLLLNRNCGLIKEFALTDPPLQLLLEQLPFPRSTSHHGTVLLRASGQVGHDLVNGPIGNVFVDGVAGRTEAKRDLIAHPEQLAEANDAVLRCQTHLVHFLPRRW